jgi:hypothetical protein
LVWTDPKNIELAEEFVPAADDVGRLQRSTHPDSLLFQRVVAESFSRDHPTTRQGIYALTPSGIHLGSINSNDPAKVAAVLEAALEKWKALPKAERLQPDNPVYARSQVNRGEDFFPRDGMALRVISRDLPRAREVGGWRGKSWNQDFAWFKWEEMQEFVPNPHEQGASRYVLETIVRRIARLHLADNVRGQTSPYADSNVPIAWLQSTIAVRAGTTLLIRFEGAAVAAQSGVWSVGGPPGRQQRGYDLKILGKAIYNTSTARFTMFELVAAGERWGGTQFNERRDDLSPNPIGFLFTLAGNSPQERIAPAFFNHYGWK